MFLVEVVYEVQTVIYLINELTCFTAALAGIGKLFQLCLISELILSYACVVNQIVTINTLQAHIYWLNVMTCVYMKHAGYVPYHLCRDGRGGGVSVYVSSHYTSCELDASSGVSHDVEYLFIECAMNDRRILIGVIYRSPGGDFDTYLGSLENSLSTHSRYDELIIAGDFNLNLLNIENSFPAANFLNLMNTYSLFSTITKPTRINRDGCTLIDDIFVNGPDFIVSGNLNFDMFVVLRDICFVSHLLSIK